MAVIILARAVGMAQAVGWIPHWRPHAPLDSALRFVHASSDYYAHVWPGATFWLFALLLAWVLSVAGLHQVVSYLMVRHSGQNVRVLCEKGEDDPEYFNSVSPAWLLIDVAMRRTAQLITLAYFCTLAWVMFWASGTVAATWMGLAIICIYTDDSLRLTAGKLCEALRMRRTAGGEQVMRALLAHGPRA